MLVAAGSARYLASQLYAVDPWDPWVYAAVAALFAIVAVPACLGPSWRAARLDAIQALRQS